MMDPVEIAEFYRVTAVEGGFQPEMRWTCKDGPLWVPLAREGFWLEPDTYSTGVVTQASVMGLEDARRAVWLAQKENSGTSYATVQATIERLEQDIRKS